MEVRSCCGRSGAVPGSGVRPRHACTHAHMLASVLQCFPKDCAKNNLKREMVLLRIFSECKINSSPRKGITFGRKPEDEYNHDLQWPQFLSFDPGWLLAFSGTGVLIKERASSFCSYLCLQWKDQTIRVLGLNSVLAWWIKPSKKNLTLDLQASSWRGGGEMLQKNVLTEEEQNM